MACVTPTNVLNKKWFRLTRKNSCYFNKGTKTVSPSSPKAIIYRLPKMLVTTFRSHECVEPPLLVQYRSKWRAIKIGSLAAAISVCLETIGDSTHFPDGFDWDCVFREWSVYQVVKRSTYLPASNTHPIFTKHFFYQSVLLYIVRRNGSVEFYGGKIKVTRTLSSFLTKFSLIFTFFVLSIFSTKKCEIHKEEEILSFLSFC